MSDKNGKIDAFSPIVTRRLFVALSVSGRALQNLADAVRKIKTTATKLDIDIKYSRPEGYHITLFFLGQTSEEKIFGLTEKLQEVAARAKRFSLDLRGFGAFPEEQAARMIWTGVSNSKELRSLQADVAAAVGEGESAAVGDFEAVPEGEKANLKEPESQGSKGQTFIPHVTLGRLRNPHSVTKLLEPLRRKDMGAVEVGELVLYESKYVNFISHYTPLARFPFGDRDDSR